MSRPGPPRPDGRADARFAARAVLAAVALVLVAVPFGLLLLLVRAGWPPLRHVDTAASVDLHRYAVAHPGFVTSMRVLSYIGSTWTWTALMAVTVGWLAWRRRPRLAVFAAVTLAASSLLNNLVKVAVDRARPVLPDPVAAAPGLSFPSGHAQSAVVGYGILVLVFLPVLPRRARPVAIALAALMVAAIGFSRIALGVHFVSDVLAGYALGAAWLAAMVAAFDAWRVERGRPPAGPATGGGTG
jgi:undecaprenyl-diphosphatase